MWNPLMICEILIRKTYCWRFLEAEMIYYSSWLPWCYYHLQMA